MVVAHMALRSSEGRYSIDEKTNEWTKAFSVVIYAIDIMQQGSVLVNDKNVRAHGVQGLFDKIVEKKTL